MKTAKAVSNRKKEPNTKEAACGAANAGIANKAIRNGDYLLMDLSHGTNPEVLGTNVQNGMPAMTPRFGLGPWIGARVASQHGPILRPGHRHGNGDIAE